MIEGYLRQLDEILSTSPAVSSIEVLRRAVQGTGVESSISTIRLWSARSRSGLIARKTRAMMGMRRMWWITIG